MSTAPNNPNPLQEEIDVTLSNIAVSNQTPQDQTHDMQTRPDTPPSNQHNATTKEAPEPNNIRSNQDNAATQEALNNDQNTLKREDRMDHTLILDPVSLFMFLMALMNVYQRYQDAQQERPDQDQEDETQKSEEAGEAAEIAFEIEEEAEAEAEAEAENSQHTKAPKPSPQPQVEHNADENDMANLLDKEVDTALEGAEETIQTTQEQLITTQENVKHTQTLERSETTELSVENRTQSASMTPRPQMSVG